MTEPDNKPNREIAAMALAGMWVFVIMILGTVFGVWLKLFVAGWVLQGMVCR